MVVQIDATELKKRLDASEYFSLIDVREDYEHEEYNIGGELIPLGTLMSRIEGLDKSGEYVLYCRSGNRSNLAAQAMVAQGFEHVSNLAGGMIGWKETFEE